MGGFNGLSGCGYDAVAFLPTSFSASLLSRISAHGWSGLEIAYPDDDSAHTHQVSALVGTAHVAGWSLHMNKTAFGNGASRVSGFGTLTEFVEPIRNVALGDVGSVITLGHGSNSWNDGGL
jgi:hypothetical protein